jgi:hypothetical protein
MKFARAIAFAALAGILHHISWLPPPADDQSQPVLM